MSDEEESDEVEQRDTELWDDSEYEASGSSTVTSAQLSGESHKKPRYSCTFHPEPGQLYREKGRCMLVVLSV